MASPAGSGKTTLAASYLAHRGLPAIWYRADAGDHDSASFFYYMGIAASAAAPRRRKPLPLLTPEYRAGLPTFTCNYFRELFAGLARPSVLILDDYQDVPNDSVLHQLLPYGLNQIVEGVNVIVMSRSEPPATFARLIASDRIVFLGWDALQLTEKETGGIVRQRLGRQRSFQASTESLHLQSGGWVTGLVLLLEQARDICSTPKFVGGGTATRIFDYFANEIFHCSDAPIQSFLLKTALLPRVSVAAARRLTAAADAGLVLNDLTRRNYFTFRNLADRDTFEYHPLFRAFLVNQAIATFPPEELRQLRQRSAELLAESGDPETAVSLLREAEDWPAAIRMMLEQARSLVAQGRLQTLQTWLDSVPAPIRDNDPQIPYWLGVCRLPFRPHEARSHFEAAFSLLERRADSSLLHLAWSGIIESVVAEGNDYAALDLWLDAFPSLALHRTTPTPEGEIASVLSYVNGLFHRRSDDRRLPKYATVAESLLRKPDAARWFAKIGAVIYYYLWNGDLAKAEQLLQRLSVTSGVKHDPPWGHITWCVLLSFHACLTCGPEECVRIAEEGLALARTTGVHISDHLLLGRCVYGHLLGGDISAARKALRQMTPTLGRARLPDALYHQLASVISLRDGNLAHAAQESECAVRMATASGWLFAEAMALVSAAIIAARKNDVDGALSQIDRARLIGMRMGSALCTYFCAFAEASVRFIQGDSIRAFRALDEALTLGTEMGMLNPPWFLREEATTLYGFALERRSHEDYLKTVIRRLRLRSPRVTLEAWPWPIRIYTLGRFEVIRDGAQIAVTRKTQRKPLELLRMLVAQGGGAVNSAKLAGMLWPDSDGDLAKRSFDVNLHRLRRWLGVEGCIILRDGEVSIDTGCCWLDLWAIDEMPVEPEAVALIEGSLTNALSLYRGPFLPGEDAAWVTPMRERLQSKFLRVVINHARRLEEQRRESSANDWYQKVLELDPLAEDIYRSQMSNYWRLGRPAEAIAVYHRCERMLRSVLHIDPTPETKALYRAVQKASNSAAGPPTSSTSPSKPQPV